MKTPCSREYTLTVAQPPAPVVCASCAYDELFAELDDPTEFLEGTPSTDPAWQGVFDKETLWHSGEWPMYYFENQSMWGIVCTPNKSIPGWQEESDYCQLYWGGASWELWLGNTTNTGWSGTGPATLESPVGLYTAPMGEGNLPPDYVYVNQRSDGSFCLGSVPVRGDIAEGSWPVTRHRIQAYSDFLTALTAKPTCSDGSAFPVWDGTFPTMRYSAGMLFWDAEALPDPDYSYKNVKGMKGVNLSVFVSPSTVQDPYWQVSISCEVGGSVWIGKKFVGKTADGVYIRTGGSSPGPACLTIESY